MDSSNDLEKEGFAVTSHPFSSLPWQDVCTRSPPSGGPSSEPSDLGPQAEPSVSVCFDLWFPSQLSSQPDIFLFTYFLSL